MSSFPPERAQCRRPATVWRRCVCSASRPTPDWSLTPPSSAPPTSRWAPAFGRLAPSPATSCLKYRNTKQFFFFKCSPARFDAFPSLDDSHCIWWRRCCCRSPSLWTTLSCSELSPWSCRAEVMTDTSHWSSSEVLKTHYCNMTNRWSGTKKWQNYQIWLIVILTLPVKCLDALSDAIFLPR